MLLVIVYIQHPNQHIEAYLQNDMVISLQAYDIHEELIEPDWWDIIEYITLE